jgi:hypothetical protein
MESLAMIASTNKHVTYTKLLTDVERACRQRITKYSDHESQNGANGKHIVNTFQNTTRMLQRKTVVMLV